MLNPPLSGTPACLARGPSCPSPSGISQKFCSAKRSNRCRAIDHPVFRGVEQVCDSQGVHSTTLVLCIFGPVISPLPRGLEGISKHDNPDATDPIVHSNSAYCREKAIQVSALGSAHCSAVFRPMMRHVFDQERHIRPKDALVSRQGDSLFGIGVVRFPGSCQGAHAVDEHEFDD